MITRHRGGYTRRPVDTQDRPPHASHPGKGNAGVTHLAHRRMILCTLLAAATLVACRAKDEPIESGRGFLTTVYTDSQREIFSRSTRYLRGSIVARRDTIDYLASLGDSGLVRSVDLTVHANGRSGPSVFKRRYVMPKSTMPMLMGSGAFFEQIFRRVQAIGGDSVSVPVVHLGPAPSLDVMTVAGKGQDSLVLSFQTSQSASNTIHVGIDSAWRITGAILPLSGMRIRPQE